MRMRPEETECKVEEDTEVIRKVRYTGLLKDVEFHSDKMFRIVFDDDACVFVNNAHLHGWKMQTQYEIRVIVNKNVNTSEIFQINGNSSIF